MALLSIGISYFLGSIPTAYLASKLLQGRDIRQIGDGNMGAQNAYRHIGSVPGVIVGLIDAGKGVSAIWVTQYLDGSSTVVMLAGLSAIAGHNWPVFLKFRGGRGVCVSFGVLLMIIGRPMLWLLIPALIVLLVTRKVIPAIIMLFAPFPLICWLIDVPVTIELYAIGLLCLTGVTHLLRTRHPVPA